MKNVFLISFLLIAVNSFSQDRIIKSNGDTLDCKITNIDSVNVYFQVYREGNLMDTYKPISDTKEIFYYSNSNGNTSHGPILFSKESGSYIYYHNGARYSPRKLGNIIKNDPVAYMHYRKYKTSVGFGDVFSWAGGFCLGYVLGELISKKPVNNSLLAAGVGLNLLSIPFYSAKKNLHKSIDIYNERLEEVASNEYEMSFGFKNGLLSLSVRFNN